MIPASGQDGDRVIAHATTVAVNGRGLVILGPSGSGKSGLALQMMALGARLLADDRTELERRGAAVIARCPPRLSGLIEARGVGLLRADPVSEVAVALVADLGQRETERLPPRRQIPMLGVTMDLVLGQGGLHFPAALMVWLRGDRVE